MSEERYEIRGKIGQGGVGAVYRAYDTQLRREVAIKRVLADEDGNEDVNQDTATANLLKEATALSSVQHPHICTVYDAGIDKEGPFVVMELINGKTLDEMVDRGTLTFDDFREVAIQSQEAMIAAQDLDLVHRDLKPSNVMVCWLPSGRFQVKLVDFGLAKFSAKPSLQTIDHGDAVFGSIFFMAPEQFERTPLDRRTDMYALGCMYYYSLAGTYPFNGDSAPQVMAGHLQNSVQPLQELRPDLPAWVCEWVMWHISRNMEDRPDSARVALERFINNETIAAQNGGVVPSAASSPQLVIPATASNRIQPATAATPVQPALSGKTAPQSITSPTGVSAVSQGQRIQPASAITGGTAIQPARPAIASNPTITPETGANPVTPAVTTPEEEQAAAAAAAAEQQVAIQAKAKKQKTLIIGAVAGVVVLGGVAVMLMGSSGDVKRFNALTEQAADITVGDLPTTEEDTRILLTALNDDTLQNRHAIHKRLMKASEQGDFSVDQMILEHIAGIDPNSEDAKHLATVIGQRNNNDAIAELLKIAVKHPNTGLAKIAIEASSKTINQANFKPFLSILSATDKSDVKRQAERALKDTISKSRDKGELTNLLLGSFDSSLDKNFRLAMIRLLGNCGSPAAKLKLEECLKSSESGERIAAAVAFSSWPNDEPFDALIDAYASEESISAKDQIFKNAIALLSSKRNHNESEIANRWMTLAGYSNSDKHKFSIINAAAYAKQDWSRAVLEYYTSNEHSNSVRNRAQDKLSSL
ncbi:protein kinase domain-containing protein [Rubritalea marina]|uniref:protein kinase domain-containing protein n=1 Tax=Rubritalea marina TaxID=361055 RepID=UPI0003A2C4FC|nr:protein kinase [Rubritalea marina]